MKISTLVICLLFSGLLSLHAERPAAPFHTDNIVLKNFQAIQVATGAKIVWEFTSEEKDVTCNLEKSTDGVNFTVLTTIILPSTRTQALHSFTDRDAAGKMFYRLRVTKESYIPYISPIVSLTIAKYTAAMPQAAPITALKTNTFFGDLAERDVMMSLQLVDLNGHTKINKGMKGTDLERNFRPSFGRLPAGYYVLRVNDMQNKTLLNRFIYKF